MRLRRPNGRVLTDSVASALSDGLAIAREMVVWPARLWMAAAEIAGRGVLRVWVAFALPALRLAARVGAAALAFGERVLTPARGLALVAVAATVALGASQFSDYRAVEVGAPQYSGVEDVAPAPEVDQQTARSAHGITVFAIAVAALFVTLFAVGRNWRLARLLVFLGAAVLVIGLAVDAHEGLREGAAAITYEGAKATLLGGFWIELASAVTLMVVGPLLAANLRRERDARTARPASMGRASVAGPLPGAGIKGAAT